MALLLVSPLLVFIYNPKNLRPITNIYYHFVYGAYVEILGTEATTYEVKFIDGQTEELVYLAIIEVNQWCRTYRRWFTKWKIEIRDLDDGCMIKEINYDCSQKNVLISFCSASLGDTIAWIASAHEFGKEQKAKIICRTHHNDLFRKSYQHIKFVEPETIVTDLYAAYEIGLFTTSNGHRDELKNPVDLHGRPLELIAADILGLESRPPKPIIDIPDDIPLMSDDYVCIGFHSTAQAKYWNNPDGWNQVISWLKGKGLKVMLLSKEGLSFRGNHVPDGVIPIPPGELSVIINYLRHARFFIGIGSGLSWLSWAIGCKTVLISGFTSPEIEMEDCIRIEPADTKTCTGCFSRTFFDKDDWNWCPYHKGTERMFECSRSIEGKDVIEMISPLLYSS